MSARIRQPRSLLERDFVLARALPDSVLEDPAPALDRIALDRIGRELRIMFADIARQPIPLRFADLLDRLDRQDEDHDG